MNWARGVYVGDSMEQGMLRNAKALGGVDVLDQVIEMIEGIGSGE